MLTRLTIRNLVIVRELELAFEPGMSALTGETGAGKSIMIDALGLTLGDKADTNMIRQGADKAEVSSSFDLTHCPDARRWLEEHDLGDEDQCLLRRVLVREGRSRAYINGSPSPQGLLRELGELILNIHGQHAHQSLMRQNAQRQLLDDYAGLQAQSHQVADHYRALSEARQRREALQQAAQDRANRIDYLQFQISELEPVAELAEQISELETEHGRLAHAERLQTDTSSILYALADGEQDISSALGGLSQQLADLCSLDNQLDEARDMLEAASIQAAEAAQSLRHYQDGIDIDPQRINELDEQLGRLHDLARKHRVEVSQLPELLQQLQQELSDLQNADQQMDSLDHDIANLNTTYQSQAQQLSSARQKAAARLSDTVTNSMQTLGMKDGTFAVDCQREEEGGKHGIDHIQFLVAANPGQAAAPLASVASGGELSRISLAIQVATADCAAVPTLIFDEVDVGIGGAVAEIVGQLLRQLGNRRQVLCVTHLPQVASQAHAHYRVHKMTDGQTTETRIDALNEGQRIDEVSRMLGGVEITEQTRRHAGEMINRAQKAG